MSDDDQDGLRSAQSAIQHAVLEVARTHEGRPMPEIERALNERFAAEGIDEQPAPWMRSTVAEIAAGRVVALHDPRLSGELREDLQPDDERG